MSYVSKYDVIVTLNQGLFTPMCVMMINIFNICNKPVTFHIMQSDFSNEQIEIVLSIAEEYKTHNVNIINIDAKDFEVFENRTTRKRIPLQAYYYLMAHRYLSDSIERALYIDVDTLIVKDLLPLFEMEFNDKYLIASVTHKIKLEDYENIKEKANVELINSGVVMLNLKKFRENNVDEKFYRDKLSSIDYPVNFADQAVVNHVFWNETTFFPAYQFNHWITDFKRYQHIFSETLEARKDKYNNLYCDPYDEEKACSVIHFCGWYNGLWGSKPWSVIKRLDDDNEIFLDIPKYSMPDNEFEEIYKMMCVYYNKWYEYAKRLPIKVYDEFILKENILDYKKEIDNYKKEINFKNNIVDFFEKLAYDSINLNIFETWIVKNKNKSFALLKTGDIAGRYMCEVLKRKNVEIVFETSKSTLNELDENELSQCSKADIIVQCCVHTKKCGHSFNNVTCINISELFNAL